MRHIKIGFKNRGQLGVNLGSTWSELKVNSKTHFESYPGIYHQVAMKVTFVRVVEMFCNQQQQFQLLRCPSLNTP